MFVRNTFEHYKMKSLSHTGLINWGWSGGDLLEPNLKQRSFYIHSIFNLSWLTPLSLQKYIKGNISSRKIKIHKEHDQNIPTATH